MDSCYMYPLENKGFVYCALFYLGYRNFFKSKSANSMIYSRFAPQSADARIQSIASFVVLKIRSALARSLGS